MLRICPGGDPTQRNSCIALGGGEWGQIGFAPKKIERLVLEAI